MPESSQSDVILLLTDRLEAASLSCLLRWDDTQMLCSHHFNFNFVNTLFFWKFFLSIAASGLPHNQLCVKIAACIPNSNFVGGHVSWLWFVVYIHTYIVVRPQDIGCDRSATDVAEQNELLIHDNINNITTGWRKKNGASLSHCKYSENSMTKVRGNWWTSAILYAEHSN